MNTFSQKIDDIGHFLNKLLHNLYVKFSIKLNSIVYLQYHFKTNNIKPVSIYVYIDYYNMNDCIKDVYRYIKFNEYDNNYILNAFGTL